MRKADDSSFWLKFRKETFYFSIKRKKLQTAATANSKWMNQNAPAYIRIFKKSKIDLIWSNSQRTKQWRHFTFQWYLLTATRIAIHLSRFCCTDSTPAPTWISSPYSVNVCEYKTMITSIAAGYYIWQSPHATAPFGVAVLLVDPFSMSSSLFYTVGQVLYGVFNAGTLPCWLSMPVGGYAACRVTRH